MDQERNRSRKGRGAEPGDEIDENLKRVYSRLLEEEVPDRFQRLLEELRRKDAGK